MRGIFLAMAVAVAALFAAPEQAQAGCGGGAVGGDVFSVRAPQAFAVQRFAAYPQAVVAPRAFRQQRVVVRQPVARVVQPVVVRRPFGVVNRALLGARFTAFGF